MEKVCFYVDKPYKYDPTAKSLAFPGYRSLASEGFFNYCISLDGDVKDIASGKSMKWQTQKDTRKPFVVLTCPVPWLKVSGLTRQIENLVGAAWCLEDQSVWQNSPFKEAIERYRDFELILPTNKRKFAQTKSMNIFYWITRQGQIFADGTKKLIETYRGEKSHRKFCDLNGVKWPVDILVKTVFDQEPVLYGEGVRFIQAPEKYVKQ